MKRLVLTIAMAAMLALTMEPAGAHHSFAMFDMAKTMTISARVKELQWTAPHVLLWVVEDPTNGQSEGKPWTIELSTGPAPLTRLGWTKGSVVPGDRVMIELAPLRSGEAGGSFKKLTIFRTGAVLEGGAPQASFDNLPPEAGDAKLNAAKQ